MPNLSLNHNPVIGPTAPIAAGTKITRDRLEAALVEGRSSFTAKKTASLNAVAHAAVVALGAARKSSPKQARDWLRKEIDDANIEATRENKARESEREKGQACVSGKMTEERLKADGAADPAMEHARLRALAGLPDKEFKAGQYVKLKCEDGEDVASTAVIRFVFGLYTSGDAPLVSRYATVLDWIIVRFGHLQTVDAAIVVKTLQDEGGFEAVLRRQRQEATDGQAKKSGGSKGGRSKATQAQAETVAKESEATTSGEPAYRLERIAPEVILPASMPELLVGLFTFHCIVRAPDEIEIVAYHDLTQEEMDELRRNAAPTSPSDAPPIAPDLPAPDGVGDEVIG